MIDGSDKLLMDHRDRQVDALNKRVAELEAALKLVDGQKPPTNTGSPKLRELVNELKSMPMISTTQVLKVLYSEFPQLRAGAAIR